MPAERPPSWNESIWERAAWPAVYGAVYGAVGVGLSVLLHAAFATFTWTPAEGTLSVLAATACGALALAVLGLAGVRDVRRQGTSGGAACGAVGMVVGFALGWLTAEAVDLGFFGGPGAVLGSGIAGAAGGLLTRCLGRLLDLPHLPWKMVGPFGVLLAIGLVLPAGRFPLELLLSWVLAGAVAGLAAEVTQRHPA
jgi:hypothetical protein